MELAAEMEAQNKKHEATREANRLNELERVIRNRDKRRKKGHKADRVRKKWQSGPSEVPEAGSSKNL